MAFSLVCFTSSSARPTTIQTFEGAIVPIVPLAKLVPATFAQK